MSSTGTSVRRVCEEDDVPRADWDGDRAATNSITSSSVKGGRGGVLISMPISARRAADSVASVVVVALYITWKAEVGVGLGQHAGGGASVQGSGSVDPGALDCGCCDAPDGTKGKYPTQPVVCAVVGCRRFCCCCCGT